MITQEVLRIQETHWQQVYQQLSKVTDKLGKEIDAGILETVVALNVLGLTTTQSCEGHLDGASGAPWVDVEDPTVNRECNEISSILKKPGLTEQVYRQTEQAWQTAMARQIVLREKLMRYLAVFYADRSVSYDIRLSVQVKNAGRSRLESQGASLQEFASAATRKQRLAEYQWEMNAFTSFLKSLFFEDSFNHGI